MSKEGYLLLHEEKERSQIYYAVLGEGKLQFFSHRENGVLIKEYILSKSKLKIRGIPDAEGCCCPFSFIVAIHRSKIVDGRQIVFGKPTILRMSAPTWAERKSWGNDIHAWNRNYWGDPRHSESKMSEEETDRFFQEQYSALVDALEVASIAQSTSTLPPTQSNSFASRIRTPSRMLNSKSLKRMGTAVRQKVCRTSVTFSLPATGISIASSLQQLRHPSAPATLK